jgi:hypothetical protein
MSNPVHSLFEKVTAARAPMRPDMLTLIAVSALAYVLAVALHEHLGHASACVLLGSRATELGAFYIECDDSRLSPVAIRLVALAGPVVSFLIGVVCYLLLRRRSKSASQGSDVSFYFIWLLGSIAAMSAAGYPLFSGFTGSGDLGMSADGALFGIEPAFAVRAGLVVIGLVLYIFVVRISLVTIDGHLSGIGRARVSAAERIALTSYASGAVVSLLIGLLNPHGMVIVLSSALASSMGGTSGLAWMMFYMNRRVERTGPGINFDRNWRWIGAALVLVLGYAVLFGPTLRP